MMVMKNGDETCRNPNVSPVIITSNHHHFSSPVFGN